MTTDSHLGFPAPLLGHTPIRLPVLYDDGDCIALAKPAGVLVQQDTWFPRKPVLVEAIRYQAAQLKPEFVKLGIGESGLWAVNDLDPECHGPVLFARHRETAEALRSDYGSRLFVFRFEFISKAPRLQEPRDCDLPVARHGRLPKILVSHTTGKKSLTRFSGLASVGACAYCLAETAYPRRHQILLHALESGLPVLGDQIYARSEPPLLSRLKRDYRARDDREERPLYPGPAFFLREIEIGPGRVIKGDEPPKWKALCRLLDKYSGQRGSFF